MSVAGKVYSFAAFARDEKFAREYVSVRAFVCVRAYVCRGCCNKNERIKIDNGEWVVGSRLCCCKIVWFELQHDKTNKVVVHRTKTQISLGIRPVWSESSLCAFWVAKRPNDSSCGQRRLWSDWADDQTDLDFRMAHRSFVGFVVRRPICNLGESNECARFCVLLASLRRYIDVLKWLCCKLNAWFWGQKCKNTGENCLQLNFQPCSCEDVNSVVR